jgi:hypothetical protein
LWKKRIALNSLIEIDLVGMGRKRRTLKIQWEKKKTSISKSIRGRALRQGTAVCRNGCEATAGLSNRRGAYKAPFPVAVCALSVLYSLGAIIFFEGRIRSTAQRLSQSDQGLIVPMLTGLEVERINELALRAA